LGPRQFGEQVGPPDPHERGDGPGVLGDLRVQELDAVGQGAQAGHGGRGLDIPGGPLAQPPTGADQAGCGQAAKPPAEGIGCGHDECVELALGVGGGLDRGAAGGQPHRQRHAKAGGTRLGELVAAQGFAGGSGRVQRVGLGAVAADGPLGPVQLHHPLGLAMEEAGQARPDARQDCDGTHPRDRVVKLLIRPAAPVPGRNRQQWADKSGA
jgi:hypothetical protein